MVVSLESLRCEAFADRLETIGDPSDPFTARPGDTSGLPFVIGVFTGVRRIGFLLSLRTGYRRSRWSSTEPSRSRRHQSYIPRRQRGEDQTAAAPAHSTSGVHSQLVARRRYTPWTSSARNNGTPSGQSHRLLSRHGPTGIRLRWRRGLCHDGRCPCRRCRQLFHRPLAQGLQEFGRWCELEVS